GAVAGALAAADQRASARGRSHNSAVVLLAVADRVLFQTAQGRRPTPGAVAAADRVGAGPAVAGGRDGLCADLAAGPESRAGGGDAAELVGAAEWPADEVGRGLHGAGPAGRAVGVAGHAGGDAASRSGGTAAPGPNRAGRFEPSGHLLSTEKGAKQK